MKMFRGREFKAWLGNSAMPSRTQNWVFVLCPLIHVASHETKAAAEAYTYPKAGQKEWELLAQLMGRKPGSVLSLKLQWPEFGNI